MPEVKVVDVHQMRSRSRLASRDAASAFRDSRRSVPAEIVNHHEAEGKQSKPVTIAAAPKKAKKLKVAAYCRVSTLMDSQETSIESQRIHYEEHIRKNPEWEFAGIYLEAGVSGTKAELRPELQKMLADCRDHKIDLILTKSISRFARNCEDCLQMCRELQKLGVIIWFEKENIHTETMDSEFMLTILACFAEMESHSISGNMKWSIQKSFETGTYKQSIIPYGYEWKEDALVIVPETAAVVKRIFQMILSGTGTGTIAKELNLDQIPSPTGKLWTQGTIRQILKNPIYVGDMLYQKTFMDETFRQRVNYGEKDQYYDAEHHEPIISREDFELAEAAIAQRAKEVGYSDEKPKGRGSNRYCFSGILKCKCCGSVLYRQREKRDQVSWVCGRHVNSPNLCRMKPQSEEDVKRAFITCLNKLAWAQRNKNPDRRVLDVYETMLGKSEAEKNADRLAEIEALLEENRVESQKLQAVIMRDHFLPEHREKKTFLTSQAKELITEKNRILIGGVPKGTIEQLKSFLFSWEAADTLEAFPEDTFTTFVESCEVNAGKMVTFHFRCGLKLTESLYRSELEEEE